MHVSFHHPFVNGDCLGHGQPGLYRGLEIYIFFGDNNTLWTRMVGQNMECSPGYLSCGSTHEPNCKEKKKKKKKERMESWRLSFVDTRNGHGLRGTLRDRSHAQEAAVLLSKTGIYSLMPARKKRKRVDDEGARLPKT